MIRTRAVVAALVLAPVAVTGAQRTESTSEFRWSDRIEAGRTLKVTNLSGTVTVRTGTGDRVEVEAVKRWRRGDPASVKIYAAREGGDVRVCPLYDQRSRCDERDWRGDRDDRRDHDSDVEVDFTVLVPRGVHVVAATLNGPVSVVGATEDVDAASINGDVTVESGRGRLKASTVQGTVRATIAVRPTDIEFATVNGNVIADLAPTIGADVEMTTLNGDLRTDYDVVVHSGRFNPFKLSAHVGPPGGPRMHLRTINGNVELRKR